MQVQAQAQVQVQAQAQAQAQVQVQAQAQAQATPPPKISLPTKSSLESSDASSINPPERNRIDFVKTGYNTNKVSKRKELSHNGSIFQDSNTKELILWSQTRSEVLITIPFDSQLYSTKSIHVQVQSSSKSTTFVNPILPYSNRHCAVQEHSMEKGILSISAKRNSSQEKYIFLSGSLPHFIHGTQEEDENDHNHDDRKEMNHRQVEWEIINDCSIRYGNSTDFLHYLETTQIPSIFPSSSQQQWRSSNIQANALKCIQITLRKAVPMYGMYLWWDQPLLHSPKIDISSLSDRHRNRLRRPHSSSKPSFSTVWEQAHQQFQSQRRK